MKAIRSVVRAHPIRRALRASWPEREDAATRDGRDNYGSPDVVAQGFLTREQSEGLGTAINMLPAARLFASLTVFTAPG
jgi:hypothetical protein